MAITVVVALLSIEHFITGKQHGYAMAQQQYGNGIPGK